jgi:predicted amidohydrolase
MKIGYYQFQPRFGEIQINAEKVLEALKNADADLIVLPELPFTGYVFDNRHELSTLAEEPLKSPTVEALVGLCQQNDLHLVTGFAEKEGDRIFNSSLLLGPSGIIATYRKLHLFDREKLCFDAGNLPLEVFDVGAAKVGMMICFDWIFPEVCRILTLEGANIVCHPSNLVLNYCQQSMLTRTLENGIFTITCNRTGEESHAGVTLHFTGQSQIVAPKGELLQRSSADEEVLVIVDIDPGRSRDKMMTSRNHQIHDRRPEWYGKLISPK